MSDQYLMNHLMYGSKVINDLYMHGFIEATNEKVFVCFTKALQETSKMHNEIFKEMDNMGFYNMTNVDEKKIKQTKEKLESKCNECLCDEEEE